jgi:cellulose synthase/poly-beta-1,6-N-acetylglucosamine synthase-like glycosyltransferase
MSQKVMQIGSERVRLIEQSARRGKAAGLNVGVSAARGEIVVFADARQTFGTRTIRVLAERLADPAVGVVSGELEIPASETGPAQGLDFYWKLERWLRKSESEVDSCIGCTGAVYAVRKRLFTPLPEGTILDDVVIPMRIAIDGFRVAYCREAIAFDPQRLAPEIEMRRKQRTLAGNFQMLFRYPGWLVPWRNRLWWQLLSHKYLRLFAPVLLASLLMANFALLDRSFYGCTLTVQLVFYGFAAMGFFVRGRFFGIPAGFVFLNLNVMRGFWQYLTSRNSRGWAPANESGLSTHSKEPR